jgi:hypothetical protein
MKGTKKLILDFVIGAVIPTLILNNLSKPLGNIAAYVLAALIPVTYVVIDTLFISRKFNAITTYTALPTVAVAILVFWFVDGWRYALKDSSPSILSMILFFGSIVIGRPFMRYLGDQLFENLLSPDTDEKKAKVARLLAHPRVQRSFVTGTVVMGVQALITAIINFFLNLNIVTAKFDTELFNSQVGSVNLITRLLFTVTGMAIGAFAVWLIYRAVFSVLPKEDGKSQFESDLWELVNKWQPR